MSNSLVRAAQSRTTMIAAVTIAGILFRNETRYQ